MYNYSSVHGNTIKTLDQPQLHLLTLSLPPSPYGIAAYPGNSSQLLVADWGSNRTAVLAVDWTSGKLRLERNLTR